MQIWQCSTMFNNVGNSTNLSYIHNCVKLKSTLKSTKIKSDWGRGREKPIDLS